MPEGPEVRHFTDQAGYLIKDNVLISVDVVGGRYKNKGIVGLEQFLSEGPKRVYNVACKGKFHFWQLSGSWSVWITFGMSGSWRTTAEKHADVIFKFNTIASQFGSLYFVDPRHYGTLKFVKGQGELDKKLKSLGPDILQSEIDESLLKYFSNRLQQNGHKTIVEVLMSQQIVSGIGNYIKSECLYEAKISPFRLASQVNSVEAETLLRSARRVMVESYECHGNSTMTYKDVNGEVGTFAERLKVYRKEKDSMGNKIVSQDTEDSRTTWWVPTVQT